MNQSLSSVQFSPLGDSAINIRLGAEISQSTSEQIMHFANSLAQDPFSGLIECVSAYTVLSIFYDPLRAMNLPEPGETPYDKVESLLKKRLKHLSCDYKPSTRHIEIPICYDLEFGIDLTYVAQCNHLSVADVIAIHSTGSYYVTMLGFSPGFPYMYGLSKRITVPRKASPRASVPIGSVAIAGEQLGIYSIETPGGWQIIGRTPLSLFHPQQQPPTLLQAGDIVTFKLITRLQFDHFRESSS